MREVKAYEHVHNLVLRGFPESEVCNPIDFLRDSSDAQTGASHKQP